MSEINLKTAENVPFGFKYLTDITKLEDFEFSTFNVVSVTQYKTQNYIVFGFYRPISKILTFNNDK